MKHIPISKWSKDHWSTLAYIETLAVDNKGIAVPNIMRMRTNHESHPFMCIGHDGSKYPTRLKDGIAEGHDDWNCLEDAVREGLLKDIGTGINKMYSITEYGLSILSVLREHKIKGGTFSNFVVPVAVKP